MLPSPIHLKLYLEITNLDWDSFELFKQMGKEILEVACGTVFHEPSRDFHEYHIHFLGSQINSQT